jgi:hypothetical protein
MGKKFKTKQKKKMTTELPWEKNLKQSKKKDDVSFLPTENSIGKFPRSFRR